MYANSTSLTLDLEKGAIQLAINQNALIQQGEIGGVVRQNPGWLPPVFSSYVDQATYNGAASQYSPAQAKALLEKAGYHMGANGLMQKNGSGKTTLARLLVGLEQTTEGEVRIDGRTVRKPGHVAGRVQMVFQDPFASFNPRHTVGYSISKALSIQLRCSAATAVKRSAEALEEVGLHPGADFMHRMPDELSGGQRQRASIARAIGGGARLIVADEPTSMLDVSVASHVLHPYTQLLVNSTPDPRRGTHPGATVPSQDELMTNEEFSDRNQCIFASRCPHRSGRCRVPVGFGIQPGARQVRCVLHGNGGAGD